MARAIRRRIYVYGGFLAVTVGFYLYRAVRIDLFPRAFPRVHPGLDPDAKGLFSSGARVALLTAHPDDSEYCAGGLLAKLQKSKARVTLVVLTDGDKGFYPWEDAAANRRLRRAEQLAAAERWGAERVVFLGYPYGRLRETEETVAEATRALAGAEWVVSFDADYPPKVAHGDHRVAGAIAEQAAAGNWKAGSGSARITACPTALRGLDSLIRPLSKPATRKSALAPRGRGSWW